MGWKLRLKCEIGMQDGYTVDSGIFFRYIRMSILKQYTFIKCVSIIIQRWRLDWLFTTRLVHICSVVDILTHGRYAQTMQQKKSHSEMHDYMCNTFMHREGALWRVWVTGIMFFLLT